MKTQEGKPTKASTELITKAYDDGDGMMAIGNVYSTKHNKLKKAIVCECVQKNQ